MSNPRRAVKTPASEDTAGQPADRLGARLSWRLSLLIWGLLGAAGWAAIALVLHLI